MVVFPGTNATYTYTSPSPAHSFHPHAYSGDVIRAARRARDPTWKGNEKKKRKKEEEGWHGEEGTIGESRKIAIPDEMEFWYFIRRCVCTTRIRTGSARLVCAPGPSITCCAKGLHPPPVIPVYICMYFMYTCATRKEIVNNGAQVQHDGDTSPSDVHKRFVLASPGKVPDSNWQLIFYSTSPVSLPHSRTK